MAQVSTQSGVLSFFHVYTFGRGLTLSNIQCHRHSGYIKEGIAYQNCYVIILIIECLCEVIYTATSWLKQAKKVSRLITLAQS